MDIETVVHQLKLSLRFSAYVKLENYQKILSYDAHHAQMSHVLLLFFSHALGDYNDTV